MSLIKNIMIIVLVLSGFYLVFRASQYEMLTLKVEYLTSDLKECEIENDKNRNAMHVEKKFNGMSNVGIDRWMQSNGWYRGD